MTIGLIVVNAAVFVASAQADPHDVILWTLQFGHGLHPVQWISNNFVHADILHLVGNMFFLWGFGLVVEGKLGWWRFLLLYLTIGGIYGFIIQGVMLGSDGGAALGSSGVVFGLMAMALVWAPKNEMSCFLWLLFRPQLIELPITVFATIYLIWQGVVAWLTGFSMSSAMLHLTGASVGGIIGVALLKLKFVDCEGWDVFAVWAGREGASRDQPDSLSAQTADQPPRQFLSAEKADFLVTAVKNRLAAGDTVGAAKFYQQQREAHPDWRLGEANLMELIQSLNKQQLWSASVRPMVDYARQFPENSIRVQLKLAQILLDVDRRPTKALKLLRSIDVSKLAPELRTIHKKLRGRAEQLQSEGELEIADGENW